MTNEEAIGHLQTILIYSENDGYTDKAREALKTAIKALEQQKGGTWKPHGKSIGERYIWWRCSVCNQIIYSEHEQDRTTFHKYCGMCGAKMEEETCR